MNNERNTRRCDLIDKEIDGTITEEELNELHGLQREMLAYRRKVAPLPSVPDIGKLIEDMSVGYFSISVGNTRPCLLEGTKPGGTWCVYCSCPRCSPVC